MNKPDLADAISLSCLDQIERDWLLMKLADAESWKGIEYVAERFAEMVQRRKEMQSEYWKREMAKAKSCLDTAYGAASYRLTEGGADRDDASKAAAAISEAIKALEAAQDAVASVELGYS